MHYFPTAVVPRRVHDRERFWALFAANCSRSWNPVPWRRSISPATAVSRLTQLLSHVILAHLFKW